MASHFDPVKEAFTLLEDGGWVGGGVAQVVQEVWGRGVAQVEAPWHMGSRLAKGMGSRPVFFRWHTLPAAAVLVFS